MTAATTAVPTVTLRELPPAERTQERLRRHGPAALSHSELLAIMLGSGRPGANALTVANRLLAQFQGLNGLSRAAFPELCAEAGISEAKASRLLAALELGRRGHTYAIQNRAVVPSPEDAANRLQAEMSLLEQERLKAILLNAKNRELRILPLYIGNGSSSHVRAAEVFKPAIRDNSPQMVVSHNHASGDPTPSIADVGITRQLCAAGDMLGIGLLDHIGSGSGNRFVSMKGKRLGFD